MNKADKNSFIINKINELNINPIDIKILFLCFEKEYSISDLQKIVGVAYKNLLPHIKKLKKLNFLIIKDMGLGRKKLLRTNQSKNIYGFILGLFSLYDVVDIEVKNKNPVSILMTLKK